MNYGTAGRGTVPAPRSQPTTEPAGPPQASAPGPTAGGRRRRAAGRGSGGGGPRLLPWAWIPLAAILIVQATLSLRLIHADTAFQDEALYLWAGHREWAHWLHGVPVPPFSAYFSGAPVIYPPLGALADSAGGLAGARILSLAFMLGATVLAWSAASQLFGRRAGFFAAALFAIAGPTLHLGAFATYDAPSILLVALAAWCAVRGSGRRDATGWMVAAGLTLALANAMDYSTALFDLLVPALAFLVALAAHGRRAALRCSGTLLVVTASLIAAALLIGGEPYFGAIGNTVFAGAGQTASLGLVLDDSWSWAGLIVLLAVGGTAASWAGRRGPIWTALLAILAIAVVLGPLEESRLRSAATLNEHIGLGAWFAVIAAGYAVDQFIAIAAAGRTRAVVSGACVVMLVFPLSLGLSQSRATSTAWPNSASFTAILAPLVRHSSGRFLVEDPAIAEYYLQVTHWQRWSSTRNIALPDGKSTGGPASRADVTGEGSAAAFGKYIARRYFSLVALNFADTTALDHRIRADLARARYHVVQVIPYGTGTYIIYRPENPA
jgi:4-amino-4-deoxy-L-arabinose transferase-like glycosyltransferase